MKKIFLLLAILILILPLTSCVSDRRESGIVAGSKNSDGQTRIIFFDVGQGDAALIETKSGRQILIDGGPDDAVLEKLKANIDWSDKFIDVVVLTHPHADHVSGLNAVLARYEVGEVWLTGVVHTTAAYFEFLDLIKDNGIKTRVIYNCTNHVSGEIAPAYFAVKKLGETIDQRCADRIMIEDDVYFDVLWPQENLTGTEIDNLNNSSIVLKLITPDKTFMLMADAETEVEEKILESLEKKINVLKSDILKVSHQGSNDSSSEEWLEAVSSSQAIISVGENSYGHPSLRTIRRLERLEAEILRTDEDGDVKF